MSSISKLHRVYQASKYTGMQMNEIGRYIIMMGVMLIIVGGIVYILGDKTSWFGNLFGDMKYE